MQFDICVRSKRRWFQPMCENPHLFLFVFRISPKKLWCTTTQNLPCNVAQVEQSLHDQFCRRNRRPFASKCSFHKQLSLDLACLRTPRNVENVKMFWVRLCLKMSNFLMKMSDCSETLVHAWFQFYLIDLQPYSQLIFQKRTKYVLIYVHPKQLGLSS